MPSAARTVAACLNSATKFDWDDHNRKLDRQMAELRETLARDAETGRQIVAATKSMVADVTAMLGGKDNA